MKGCNRRRIVALLVCLFAVWASVYPVLAQSPNDDEEVRKILEKSLSVVELDKEIARITEQQNDISASIADSQAKLDRQKTEIASQREDAGRVLRAYYTGDRDILVRALFSSDSLSDLLAMLDYFTFIFASDKKALDGYEKQYRKLQGGVAQLGKDADKLAEMKDRLNAQRDRVSALQQDVDNSLSGRSDADKLQSMISEMTDFWENVGLFEVKRYFGALSDAMKKMPDWVQSNKEMLAIDGFNYTLTVTEDQLNEFLRQQNELFNNFSFAFEHGLVVVAGKRDGLDVKLSGHYNVEETKSGTAILFHVDELLFNGLVLPDTTRQELEKEFDLGFYPQKIVPFLKAKSVAVEKGKLTIKLSVSL